MSERLERIQQNDLLRAINDISLYGPKGIRMEAVIKDIEWLIQQAERVQELELEVNDWKDEVSKWNKYFQESEESHLETKELLKSIVNQNKRYKQALEEILNTDCNLEGLDAERELDRVTDIALKALEVEE